MSKSAIAQVLDKNLASARTAGVGDNLARLFRSGYSLFVRDAVSREEPQNADANLTNTVCLSMPTSFPAVSMDQKSAGGCIPKVQLGRI